MGRSLSSDDANPHGMPRRFTVIRSIHGRNKTEAPQHVTLEPRHVYNQTDDSDPTSAHGIPRP